MGVEKTGGCSRSKRHHGGIHWATESTLSHDDCGFGDFSLSEVDGLDGEAVSASGTGEALAEEPAPSFSTVISGCSCYLYCTSWPRDMLTQSPWTIIQVHGRSGLSLHRHHIFNRHGKKYAECRPIPVTISDECRA